jgi:hypothetical protein
VDKGWRDYLANEEHNRGAYELVFPAFEEEREVSSTLRHFLYHRCRPCRHLRVIVIAIERISIMIIMMILLLLLLILIT